MLGESVGHRLIPHRGARCEPEQVVKQFVKLLVFRDAMAPMPRHCNEKKIHGKCVVWIWGHVY